MQSVVSRKEAKFKNLKEKTLRLRDFARLNHNERFIASYKIPFSNL